MPMRTLPLTRPTVTCSHHHRDRHFGLSSHHRCFLSLHPPPLSPSASPSPSPSPSPSLPPLLASKRHRLKLSFVTRAADSTPTSSALASSDKTIVADDEFTFAKVSFGDVGLGAGVSLLSYGFGAYFNILPGSEWTALMLTFGFSLAIIGTELKFWQQFYSIFRSCTVFPKLHHYPWKFKTQFAELKPVPCLTYSDAQMLRKTCATPILKQVRNDVIRFRYGDEQYLNEALKMIFQYDLGGGIPRRSAPILQRIREEVTEDSKYCLVLEFEAKALKLSDFEKRQAKFASFFGPGITAEVGKGENNLYEVRLISDAIPTVSHP